MLGMGDNKSKMSKKKRGSLGGTLKAQSKTEAKSALARDLERTTAGVCVCVCVTVSMFVRTHLFSQRTSSLPGSTQYTHLNTHTQTNKLTY